ncbi:hypothetical protein L596_016341 [Steinernema carpocapsae]|uniref:CCR4-NOT transcription complex subunit 11 n=1 Tax=Steinernema carpocapsae TaxID=34508 RepID=A0A4U5NIP3_STECR|nr:hypothetical protein L596_016341 [Steinernema carpocapsae]
MENFAEGSILPSQVRENAPAVYDNSVPPLLQQNVEISPIPLEEYELFSCHVDPITEIPAEWLTDDLRGKYRELLKFYQVVQFNAPLSTQDKIKKIAHDPKGFARSEVERLNEELRKDPTLTDGIDFLDGFAQLVRTYPALAKEVIVCRIVREYDTAEVLCHALASMDIEVQTVETIYGVAVRCSELGQMIPADLLGAWISRNIQACEAVREDPYRASRLVRMFCGLISGLLSCKNPVTKELFDRATELKSFSLNFSGFKEAGIMYQKLSTMMGHKLS